MTAAFQGAVLQDTVALGTRVVSASLECSAVSAHWYQRRMQATAWAPADVQVFGCRGYRERHVFRVASTPQYQFHRAFSWQSRPVKVRAISEELVQRVHEENIQMNGTAYFDLPACKRQESRASTTSVHGGERGGRPRVEDSLTTPIVQTATFTFRSVVS